jgi:hypothetical protein
MKEYTRNRTDSLAISSVSFVRALQLPARRFPTRFAVDANLHDHIPANFGPVEASEAAQTCGVLARQAKRPSTAASLPPNPRSRHARLVMGDVLGSEHAIPSLPSFPPKSLEVDGICSISGAGYKLSGRHQPETCIATQIERNADRFCCIG